VIQIYLITRSVVATEQACRLTVCGYSTTELLLAMEAIRDSRKESLDILKKCGIL